MSIHLKRPYDKPASNDGQRILVDRWLALTGLVGIVPLATAFIGWCPAYALFGINTCKIRDRQ